MRLPLVPSPETMDSPFSKYADFEINVLKNLNSPNVEVYFRAQDFRVQTFVSSRLFIQLSKHLE